VNDGVLHAMGARGLLLALLIAGHVLADFLVQTGAMARRKREHQAWVWLHVFLLTLVQGAVLLPVLSFFGVLMVLGIGISHGLIDHLKIILERRRPRALVHFAMDQSLHVLVLFGAWWGWCAAIEASAPATRTFFFLPPAAVPTVTTAAVLAAAYAFNGNGGAAIVGGLLRRYHLAAVPREMAREGIGSRGFRPLAMGRTIGILERLLALTLVLAGQWGALGLVIAAKSIARFKDLEHRRFAEYYLIGTLASVLTAAVSGILVRWAL
jgi:hypothetical protein